MKLFLCEKPSQAKDIGKVLGVLSGRHDGYFRQDDTAVTWGFGHVLANAMPEAYGAHTPSLATLRRGRCSWGAAITPNAGFFNGCNEGKKHMAWFQRQRQRQLTAVAIKVEQIIDMDRAQRVDATAQMQRSLMNLHRRFGWVDVFCDMHTGLIMLVSMALAFYGRGVFTPLPWAGICGVAVVYSIIFVARFSWFGRDNFRKAVALEAILKQR